MAVAIARNLFPIDKVLQQIDDISTLPQVAAKVIQVASNPDSGVSELKSVMESDAPLSARVLKCVNSSAYGIRSKITQLQQAIAYLGMKQIRNLALTASVSELFREKTAIGRYSRSELWRHLVSVGLCARMIAMRRGIENFEDAFLAGLLHDIGIVLEDQYCHAKFKDMMTHLDESKTLGENEREALGFEHTLLGEKIAVRWGFPENVRAAIRFHHGSATYRGDEIEILHCVEVANILCTLKGIASVGAKLVRNSPTALAGLSLSAADLAVMSEDLDSEIKQNSALFQV